MLIQRHVYHYIQCGTQQIHVVFDDSKGYQKHPKQIEHMHRYGAQTQHPFDDHFNPNDNTKANTRDWNTILLGRGGGAFEQSLYSTHQSFHISDPSLRCNAPEADTRIWLHAMHCVNTSGLNSLIVSADTDTAFIGIYHQKRSMSRLICIL